jgi:hypothetical protein
VDCHVCGARRLTSSSGSGHRGRVGDFSRRSVRPHSKVTDLPDPQLATGEGPESVDGLTRAGVTGRSNLEEEEGPLGAVCNPHGEHPPILLAQRQSTGRVCHGPDYPTRPQRANTLRTSASSPMGYRIPAEDQPDGRGGYSGKVVQRFDHGGDAMVRVIAGPGPENYEAAWESWLDELDSDEPVDPDVPASVELARARDAGEV